jgi:hypothetical protein
MIVTWIICLAIVALLCFAIYIFRDDHRNIDVSSTGTVTAVRPHPRARMVDDQQWNNIMPSLQQTADRLNKALEEKKQLQRELKVLVDDRDMYVHNVREYTNTNCMSLPLDERPDSMRQPNNNPGPR